MYVCVCKAVTESQVRDAIRDGLRSLRALREHLGVSSECGKCAGSARGILRECQTCVQDQEKNSHPWHRP